MTTTANKGYTKPTVGADFDTWGGLLNTDFDIIDSNLGGIASVNVAGNSNVMATADNAKCLVQLLSGALTGNISYLLPAVGSLYIIDNETTGAFSITVKTVAGGSTGVVVPRLTKMAVYSDGTNVSPVTTAIKTSGNPTVIYFPGGIMQIIGNATTDGTGSVSVSFTPNFSGTPTSCVLGLNSANPTSGNPAPTHANLAASGVTLNATNNSGGIAASVSYLVTGPGP